ncbi:hypothetical protein KBD59_02050 [Candidatus Gracilibacteria bacterium]|nr:hypothetical protein [Candidatus Gracilibacteria bacterium]
MRQTITHHRYIQLKAALIILGALATVLVMHLVQRPVDATTPEQKNKYLDMASNIDAVDQIIAEYHKTVNAYFNNKTKEMMKIAKSGTDEDLNRLTLLITPPEQQFGSDGLPTKRKDCKGSGDGTINLSTYCASMDMTKEYFLMREALSTLRGEAMTQAIQRFETLGQVRKPDGSFDNVVEQPRIFGGGTLGEGQRRLQDYGQIANHIDSELDLARKALDQGLAAYNELQLALPMHVKYKKITVSLEKYRDKLSELRQDIEFYPATFIDVTTPACK